MYLYIAPIVDLTNTVEGVCDAKTRFWIEELNLHQSDQQCITSGDWLNDRIVTVGSTLLKQAFPHLGGLQDTLLAETLSLDVSRSGFVQVNAPLI